MWSVLLKSLFLFILPSLAFAQISADFGGVNGGGVRLGEAPATTCNSTTQGSVRFDSSGNSFEACDGFNWRTIQLVACPDNLPDDWTFNNLSNQTTSTLVTSNIFQVNGIVGCTVSVDISGDGSPEYRTCSDSSCTTEILSWRSTQGSISNGEYIQLRTTTNAAGAYSNNISTIVGARSESWQVTTLGDCSDPSPPIGTYCADGTYFVGFSPDGGAKMYTTPCDEGNTWDGSVCSGSDATMTWSQGSSVTTGITNQTTGEANTIALAALSNADSPYNAAIRCNDLIYGGHSDWYLPSVNEWNTAFSACEPLPDWGCVSQSSDFWMASEESSDPTRADYREKDNQGTHNGKTASNKVRCFRKD